MDDQSKVQYIQAVHSMLTQRFATLRTQQKRAYDYVIGDQITAEIRKKLTDHNRPALVYNLLLPLLLYVCGILYRDRVKMRAAPFNEGDEEKSWMHTLLVGDYAIGEDGYREISKAAIDSAIGKIGWVNQFWSTREDPEGRWLVESFDPFMVMWDVDGRREDQKDWRYIDVSAFYSAEEIIQIYDKYLDDEMREKIRNEASRIEGIPRTPGQPIGWIQRIWNSALEFTGVKRRTDTGEVNDYIDSRHGVYRVVEFHDRRTVDKSFIYSPYTRESMEIPADKKMDESYQAELLNSDQYPGGQILTRVDEQLWITVVVPALITDKPVVEIPYPIQGKGFSLKPIFCYSFHPDLTKATSIMDSLLDPQDSYNQRRMSMLEWIMDAVNPDYLVPKGSIKPEDKANWQSKDRGVLKEFIPRVGQKPEPEKPLAEGSLLQGFAAEDQDLIAKISGLSPNLQGFKESQRESGTLYARRVQQGLTMLTYFFGNVEAAMRWIFNYCDAGMQKYLTLPRAIRLFSPENGDPTWLQLNMPTIQGVMNDVSQGEYDFRPDKTQLGETAKQMKFMEAMEFVMVMPPEMVYWPLLFELWDSPVSKKMKQFAEMRMGVIEKQLTNADQAQNVNAALQAAGAIQQLSAPPAAPNPQQQARQRR
jgi:hypothetical protein